MALPYVFVNPACVGTLPTCLAAAPSPAKAFLNQPSDAVEGASMVMPNFFLGHACVGVMPTCFAANDGVDFGEAIIDQFRTWQQKWKAGKEAAAGGQADEEWKAGKEAAAGGQADEEIAGRRVTLNELLPDVIPHKNESDDRAWDVEEVGPALVPCGFDWVRGSGEDLVLGGVDNLLDWAGVAGAIGSSTDLPATDDGVWDVEGVGAAMVPWTEGGGAGECKGDVVFGGGLHLLGGADVAGAFASGNVVVASMLRTWPAIGDLVWNVEGVDAATVSFGVDGTGRDEGGAVLGGGGYLLDRADITGIFVYSSGLVIPSTPETWPAIGGVNRARGEQAVAAAPVMGVTPSPKTVGGTAAAPIAPMKGDDCVDLGFWLRSEGAPLPQTVAPDLADVVLPTISAKSGGVGAALEADVSGDDCVDLGFWLRSGGAPLPQTVAPDLADVVLPTISAKSDGVGAALEADVSDDSALSRQLGGGLAVMLAPAVLLLLAYRRVRWKKNGRLRKASSLRVAKAEQTVARFISAAVRRHRDVQQKAAILEQALSRQAAARRRRVRRLKLETARTILVQTRSGALAVMHQFHAKQTAAVEREELVCQAAKQHRNNCLKQRAWVGLMQWRAHAAAAAAAKRRKKQEREASRSGAAGRLRVLQPKGDSDMEQAASLDVASGFADASAVRDTDDATGGSRSPPRPALSDGPVGGNGELRSRQVHDTLAATTRRPTKATYQERRKQRELKKEAKESGDANKVNKKPTPYSSAQFDDKMVTAGRGGGSGGVSVEDDVSQEAKTEHGCCMAKPSPAPPETQGTVPAKAAATLGAKGRTPRPGASRSIPATPPSHTGLGARAHAPTAKAKGRTPWPGASGSITATPPSHTGLGSRASAPPAKAKGRTPRPGASGSITATQPSHTGPGARASAPPAKAKVGTPGEGKRSARTPPAEPHTKPPGLSKEESIFGSRNPAILGWDTWFGGGLRLKVDPDGNCFGVSWMVASLLSAVQTPRSLDEFIGKLKEAAQPSGAFSIVPTSVQRYTDYFMSYVDELRSKWNDIPTEEEAAHGVSLAVEVVLTLRGQEEDGEEDGDPLWLQLKWGIALAARALDVSSAPASLPVEDMVNLRKMGESVEFSVGTADVVSTSKDGEAADNPVDDALRPGRGLCLAIGVVVASLAGVKTLSAESINHAPLEIIQEEMDRRLGVHDLTEHFRSVSNDPPVSGMALVKGVNPHFDVLTAAETPLAAALANSFPIEGGDVEAFTDLLRQEEGRVETTQAQLEEMYPEECARAREEQRLEQAKAAKAAKGTDGQSDKGTGSKSAKNSSKGRRRSNKRGR